LIAEGLSSEEAKEKIGMVVEGAYSCLSAMELGQKGQIPLPISETVYSILYEGLQPMEAVSQLMMRPVKEERL
jgi:glycerol-3-phosphate dehydrogenase (NAD(P)+)